MPEPTVPTFQSLDGILYKTTPAELTARAVDIRTTQIYVEGELSALQGYVRDLETAWGGIASQTFQRLMEEWNMHAANLEVALLGIADGLDGNAANYTGAEGAAVTNLSGVQIAPAKLG
ncbi:WXG100 family type VII secretion target [Streptomyces sp. NPDC013178]|uniref:WXG100 family type VII secretion target n=1 Tax=Streptomyces sp. NPDC013178 TaxID=3155118 RepID=UPI0033E70EA6